MLPRDTSEKAARIQFELQDKLGFEGRFKLIMEMSQLMHEFARAGLRAQRPELPEPELSRELARVLYGK
jgi:hypothetical protein